MKLIEDFSNRNELSVEEIALVVTSNALYNISITTYHPIEAKKIK